MKTHRILLVLIPMQLICMQTEALSQSGRTIQFDVNQNGNFINIIPVANYNYSRLGYRIIDDVGVDFLHTTSQINGFYSIPASSTQPFSLSYSPISGPMYPTIEVCLNVFGAQPIGCEKSTLTIAPGSNTFLTVGYTQKLNSLATMMTHDFNLLEDLNYFTAATKLAYGFYSADIVNDAWTTSTLPADAASIEGLECETSGYSCFAVGRTYDGANGRVEGYAMQTTDAGQTWSSVTLPSEATSNNIASYGAIGCSSDGTTCHSIANLYRSSFANTTPIDFTYASGSWSTNTSFSLLDNGNSYIVRSLKCAADDGNVCIAVGTYIDSSQASETSTAYPLIMNLSDGTWTASTFSLPSDTTQVFLNDVACNYNSSSLSTCTAVGSITTGSPAASQPAIFYSTDGGSSWSQSTLPSLPTDEFSGQLNAVSCSSDGTTCMVVGSYQTGDDSTANTVLPLVYQSSNSGETWQNTTSTLSVDTDTYGGAMLTGVYCATDSETCTLVGVYGNGAKNPLSFVTSDFGASWTDNSPTKSSGIQASLRSVSCDQSTGAICTTVGGSIADPSYFAPGFSKQLFQLLNPSSVPSIFRSDDSGKTLNLVPDSSELTGELRDVIYVNSTDAYAVGAVYTANNQALQPLIKKITGSTIQTITPVTPGVAQLFSIAKVLSNHKLIAVGELSQVAFRSQPLVYSSSDSGSTWQRDTLPEIPLNAKSATFNNIQCTQNECYALGSYQLGHIFPYILKYTASNNQWSSITLPKPVEDSSGPIDTMLTRSAVFNDKIVMSAITMINNIIQPVFYIFDTVNHTYSDPILIPLNNSVAEAVIHQIFCSVQLKTCYALGAQYLNNGSISPLFLAITPATMGVDLRTIVTPPVGDGLVLQSISCNSPSNSVCSIVGQRIQQGVSTPVSLTSLDAGLTWIYNGVLPLVN